MVSMKWRPNDNGLLPSLAIRQVYCWIIDTTGKVVIVSKNKKDWQFPGGKPEINEDMQTALIREIHEETGICLEGADDSPELFGYYIVTNDAQYGSKDYLQLRYHIRINLELKNLKPRNNNSNEEVKFVKCVSLDQLFKIIPWMDKTGEYRELVRMGFIR